MTKNSIIKWRKEDEKVLRKAVSDFNKKVQKISKGKKDKSYLPSKISYKETKELIKTRSELNRVLKSLGRFGSKGSYKKVTLPSGQELTNWEKKEISYQKASAVRRIRKRMAEIKTTPYMGNVEYRKLEATLKNVQNAYNFTGKRYERAISRIKKLGTSDYEIKVAEIYKNNYLTMLQKAYGNAPEFEEIYEKLKAIKNPIKFYEVLSSMQYGDYIKDIKFMYDSARKWKSSFKNYVRRIRNFCRRLCYGRGS